MTESVVFSAMGLLCTSHNFTHRGAKTFVSFVSSRPLSHPPHRHLGADIAGAREGKGEGEGGRGSTLRLITCKTGEWAGRGRNTDNGVMRGSDEAQAADNDCAASASVREVVTC